jgi:hypothetical protein
MCNLSSITTNQAAIIALFRVMNRYVGKPPDWSSEKKADMPEHAAISSRPQVRLNGLALSDRFFWGLTWKKGPRRVPIAAAL